jgi:hypothetical protein
MYFRPKVIDRIAALCPYKGERTCAPEVESEIRIVASSEADAILVESGENVTEVTSSLCPDSIWDHEGQDSVHPYMI